MLAVQTIVGPQEGKVIDGRPRHARPLAEQLDMQQLIVDIVRVTVAPLCSMAQSAAESVLKLR